MERCSLQVKHVPRRRIAPNSQRVFTMCWHPRFENQTDCAKLNSSQSLSSFVPACAQSYSRRSSPHRKNSWISACKRLCTLGRLHPELQLSTMTPDGSYSQTICSDVLAVFSHSSGDQSFSSPNLARRRFLVREYSDSRHVWLCIQILRSISALDDFEQIITEQSKDVSAAPWYVQRSNIRSVSNRSVLIINVFATVVPPHSATHIGRLTEEHFRICGCQGHGSNTDICLH